jgi:two-component system OmpR family response regulator
MKPLKVILMMSEVSAREEVVVALQQAGIAVDGCSAPLELFSQLASGNYDAAVLDIDWLDEVGYALISRLSMSPSLGIVVLGSQLQIENRLRCLQSGADACLSHPFDPRELVGVLMALAKRLPGRTQATQLNTEAPASTPQVGSWELRDQNWTLVAPNGVSISLSANERHIVRTLLEAAGEAVAREELGGHLGDAAARAGGSRSIDVIISRLRRKAELVGINLPIRTVYGSGYLFADQ